MICTGISPLRWHALLAICLITSHCSGQGAAGRLIDTPPDRGRSVQTERGYMIPYAQRIPGTNATIEMIPVPGGEIELNPILPRTDDQSAWKPRGGLESNGERFQIKIRPFWIGKFEITMKQFLPYRSIYFTQKEQAFRNPDPSISPLQVDAVTGPTDVYDTTSNFEYAESLSAPVPTVTQFAARQYTKWLSLATRTTYRLPFRSEWQHACLAGSRSRFCFGEQADELHRYAVYEQNSHDVKTLLVGTKSPNRWDLHDMHGNVAEWVIEDTAIYGMYVGHVACGGHLESPAPQCAYDAIIRSKDDWWDQDPDLPRSCWWMTSFPSQGVGFRIISPLDDEPMAALQPLWNPDSQRLLEEVNMRIDDGRGSIGRVSVEK